MKFIFICTQYPSVAGDSSMTSELASELAQRGHEVDVLHIRWQGEVGLAPRAYRVDTGFEVIEVSPRAVTGLGDLVFRVSKLLSTSAHAKGVLKRHLRPDGYDAVVTWTPALTVAGPLKLARARATKSVLFIFDFFPIHHREIGMVPPGPVYWAAKCMENALYRTFSTIVCNWPGNIPYLRKHYQLRPSQNVISTPLWSRTDIPQAAERGPVRAELGLPEDRPIAIFGGQITDGRGIPQILEAAAHAEQAGSKLVFLFVGNGRLVDLVKARAGGETNVCYVAGLPRDRYLRLVSACDVGLVATVQGVSSFSFPTKTMDYLRAGLPIVAAVESGSDYLELLTRYRVGTAVGFDDTWGFYEQVERFAGDPEVARSIRQNSIACLEEVFHVRHAADALLRAVAIPNGQPC